MHLLLFWNTELLYSLSKDLSPSPEELLSYLEEALESGELTIDEVAQLVQDFNRGER